jgi:hypothetical protein
MSRDVRMDASLTPHCGVWQGGESLLRAGSYDKSFLTLAKWPLIRHDHEFVRDRTSCAPRRNAQLDPFE